MVSLLRAYHHVPSGHKLLHIESAIVISPLIPNGRGGRKSNDMNVSSGILSG